MDPGVWQQILTLLKDAQRSAGPQGWDTPAAAAAAIAAAAAAAEAEAALRPLKKSRLECADDVAGNAGQQHHHVPGSAGAAAGTHVTSTSADGSEGHHFSGPMSSSVHHDDQATPTTLQGLGALSAAAHSSPGFSHNQDQQQHATTPGVAPAPAQPHLLRGLMLDGSGTPTTMHAAGSTSPSFSDTHSQQGGSMAAAGAGLGGGGGGSGRSGLMDPAAAAAAGIAGASAGGFEAAAAGFALNLAAYEEGPGDDVNGGELSTQQRLVQVTMLDRLFDLTCTRFSIKDGVVAPRKFWPRVQHGSPLPIQMLLEVHDSSWDPNAYTSTALQQLGAAVRANKAAASAAADGHPAGYAAIWAQYLHVKHSAAAAAEAAGDAYSDGGGGGSSSSSTIYGPYPAILVPGQNTFGGLLRIRNIKHHGELKVPQSTPHVLVLREKVGADAIKLHIKLTKSSDVYPSKKSSAARLIGGLSPSASTASLLANEQQLALAWEAGAPQAKSAYSRLPTPSAAIAAAAAAAAGGGSMGGSAAAAAASMDGLTSRTSSMRAPKARARAEAAAAAAVAAEAMGDGAPPAAAVSMLSADGDEALAQALLDLKHVR